MAVFKWIAGGVCVIIGLSGLVLPVLPGWALILLGVYLIYPCKYKRIMRRIKAILKLREKTL